MAGHTPGPWAIRDDLPHTIDGALIYSTAAGGVYGETICRIGNKHWPRATENMDLIVAAPELEAQIDRLAKCIMDHYPDEPGRTGRSEGAVDVAIRLLEERAAKPPE
jgi:hypothetical protein